jgi:hypothetical protein
MTTIKKLEELIYQGFKETDRRMQETDRRMQETDRKIQETDRLVRELTKDITGITKSVGLFAESMVKPATRRLFAERGIEITGLHSRASERRNGSTMEIDVLAYGPVHVIAIEVKLTLGIQEVKEFLEKLSGFFGFFERYRGLILYGTVAGLSINEGVDRFAYKQGLFVLAQSGENLQLLNDDKFVPRAYLHES